MQNWHFYSEFAELEGQPDTSYLSLADNGFKVEYLPKGEVGVLMQKINADTFFHSILIKYLYFYNQEHIQMKCCPEGSWPQLAVDYAPKGQKLKVDGVTVYHVGTGSRGLMIVEDIFGIHSGRHEVVADMFASKGYNVFMPELLEPYYDGEMDMGKIVEYIKGHKDRYEAMVVRFQKTLAHVKAQGINSFVSIGFCWGVWFAFKMAAKHDCFKAISGPHPSLGAEGLILGGSPLALAQSIKCPAYLLPAGNDPEDVKEKGAIVEILIKKFGPELVGTTHFPEMVHGWVVRGDLKDEKVQRDFHEAIHITEKYFDKFK